jgi:aminoglycoside phosphotransferase (APT) family kinase protein
MIEEAKLEAALKRLPGFEALPACERLSAGASRETYRLGVIINGAARTLALRRAQGDGKSAMGAGPGLNVEARLFAAARSAGVPGPDVLLVLKPKDGLGSGFVMEWISGETLGGRIVKSPALDGARRSLARQCGQILARLHAVDVEATGLADALEMFTPEHASPNHSSPCQPLLRTSLDVCCNERPCSRALWSHRLDSLPCRQRIRVR